MPRKVNHGNSEDQITIGKECSLEGIGLHTGDPCRAVFRPAPPDSGIRFFRTDMPESPPIPAKLGFVIGTARGTNLGIGQARVYTVEHILSACMGLEIDNLDVLLSSSEPPAMDGSALPFYKAFLQAGTKPQKRHKKRYLRIPAKLRFEDNGAVYTASPSEHFSISVTIMHDHPLLRHQSLSLDIRNIYSGGPVRSQTYFSEIAAARTYCFEHELEAIRKQGLAKGGSLENAIVIGENRFHTGKEGLRFPDEFVRHKALDLIGDLALLARALDKIRITGTRCGHAQNLRFAAALNQAAKNLRR